MKIGRWVLGAMLLAPMGAAHGAIVVDPTLHAQSRGSFDFRGDHYEQSQVLESTARVSTAALVGNNDTPEVRTAGRLSGDEIAVNARADGKQIFTQAEVQQAESHVIYRARLSFLAGAPQHVFASFHMPAGYVENMNNAELRPPKITSVTQARIDAKTCADVAVCSPAAELFFFQALLESSFQDELHATIARGQAGLDITPLLSPSFTDTGAQGFTRTRNLEFPEFEGVIDLGLLEAGQWIDFEYQMVARVEGHIGFSYGIAAINDPFFFDTDPVRMHPTLRFFGIDVGNGVPEPASVALLLAAAVAAAMRRRGLRRV